MRPREWLEVVRGEYLETFVTAGGAAVKFLVPATHAAGREVLEGLRAAADELGFQFVELDAVTTKIHLADRLFGAVARQVDWDGLAGRFVSRLLVQRGLRLSTPHEGRSISRLLPD
jgi:hypothetical protein